MKLRINHSGDQSDKKKKLDTPSSTLKKVRFLIEQEGYYSTTELAERLNGFLPGDERPSEPKFPRASGAGDWTSGDVASLLDRKDMEDLKPKLTANRPVPASVPMGSGISPLEFRQALADDLSTLLNEQSSGLASTLTGLHATVDTLRREVAALENLPGDTVDLMAVKAAVGDAVNSRLREFGASDSNTEILDKVVADTADEVCAVFEKVIEKSDLPAVRRMSEAAAKNVGEVCKKIDDTTAELFDTLKSGLEDSATTISEIVVDHLNTRLAAFMGEVQVAVDEQLGGTIKAAIDAGLASVQNSFAVQHQHYERTVEGVLDRKIVAKLDKIEQRIKKLEDEERGWNE